jgi:flagellar hook-associated protein 2
MASVTTSGLNLDVQGLAAQLVAADRATQDARNTRQETALTVQVSGLGTLKGALSSFQGALQSLKTVAAFRELRQRRRVYGHCGFHSCGRHV